jgi:phosphotriesterase-related protein
VHSIATTGIEFYILPTVISAAKSPAFPNGAVVRTILKDLPPSALAGKATLFHEHLSIDLPYFGPTSSTPPPPPATADVNYVIGEIRIAGQEGVGCIVDGGHRDMGRSLDHLKQIANSTPVHIVASGGYYMQRVYPPDVASRNEDQIAEGLAHEAQENRYGALGEIGENPDAAMSDEERKVFRAVGKAHLRTNLPIFTHNAYGTGPNVPRDAGLRQLDVLEAVGVKPQRVVSLARPGYGNSLTVFLPLLRKAGIKEEMLHSIMYDNPRRFLAFVPRKVA